MKEIKRKMLLTALVIVFAFVATAGTTYAWFQISPTVEAESLNFNMQSKDSLLLRVYNGENPDDTYYYYQNDIYNFYQEIRYNYVPVYEEQLIEDELVDVLIDEYFLYVPEGDSITIEDEVFDKKADFQYRINELNGNLVGEFAEEGEVVVGEGAASYVAVLASDLYASVQAANTALGNLLTPAAYFNYITLEDIVEAYPGYLSWNLEPVTAIQPEHVLFPGTTDQEKIYAYTSVDAAKLHFVNYLDHTRSLIQIQSTDYNQPYVDELNFGKVIQLQFWVYSQAGGTRNLRMDNVNISSNNESPYSELYMDDFIDAIRLGVQSGTHEKTLFYLPEDWEEGDPIVPEDLIEATELFANPTFIFANQGSQGLDYNYAFTRGLYGYRTMYDRTEPEDQRNYYGWHTIPDPGNPDDEIDEVKMIDIEIPDPLNPGSTIIVEVPETLLGFNKIDDISYMDHGLNNLDVNDDDLYLAQTATEKLLSDSRHGILYGNPDSSIITQIVPNRPQLVTITLFVEGWDEHCTFNIIASSLMIDFSLTIKEED